MAENLRRNGGKSPCRWQTRADLCTMDRIREEEENRKALMDEFDNDEDNFDSDNLDSDDFSSDDFGSNDFDGDDF